MNGRQYAIKSIRDRLTVCICLLYSSDDSNDNDDSNDDDDNNDDSKNKSVF
jgi:hypothetical protein